MNDDLCDGCGADLNETDGNTFDMGDGVYLELCPPCEERWSRADERDRGLDDDEEYAR